MTTIEALVLLGSAILGSVAGALLHRYFSREKPVVFVKSCELSSTLLSRVDYLSLTSDISAKFSLFPWTIEYENEYIPENPAILPIGVAQENLYNLNELLPTLDATVSTLERAINIWHTDDQEQRRRIVAELLHNRIFLRCLIGMTRRGSFSILRDNNVELPAPEHSKTTFTWSLDDATGAPKGTLGAYTLNIENARIIFPFRFPDEKKNMGIISHAFAECGEALIQILREINEELSRDKSIGVELAKWLSENIDKSSTFVLSVGVTNLGKRPILFSGSARLHIPRQGMEALIVKCRCETFEDETEESRATDRTVRIFRLISRLLDKAIRIRSQIISERILVQGGEASTLTFRAEKSFEEEANGMELLNLYKSGSLMAYLELEYQVGNKFKKVNSEPFQFRSAVPPKA